MAYRFFFFFYLFSFHIPTPSTLHGILTITTAS
ncbi:MAG: CRISPR-associated protein Cas5 [Proteobacteria bacterium]|nr:CRISPR-associated protein Cas5 [Pseudomonadota bacterium]